MTTRDAFIAVNRFGLGARAGELKAASADPRGWITTQLAASQRLPEALSGFSSSAEVITAFQLARKRARRDKAMLKAARKSFRKAYMREASARIRVQIETDEPVIERLVAFWSNHFTVSVRKPIVFGVVGAFEREAIRPYVLGRFSDMLRAVVRHPAMLAYLDNVQSIGPNSHVGMRRKKGLNENLAREVLELHTLGVDGGYSQADVREFAKILTGWSVSRSGDEDGFAFQERAHEPGPKTLLGNRYPESGEAEGTAALENLARHPATARHIAFKLARHFAADQPPAELVDQLAIVFRDSNGDLRNLIEVLIDARAVWDDPDCVRTFEEFLV